jgi:hypothetical protein
MSNSRRGLTARQPLGPKRGRADLKQLQAMTDAEIRRTTPQELANPAARLLEGRQARSASSSRKTKAVGRETSRHRASRFVRT